MNIEGGLLEKLKEIRGVGEGIEERVRDQHTLNGCVKVSQ
jgi:hypothetical protein